MLKGTFIIVAALVIMFAGKQIAVPDSIELIVLGDFPSEIHSCVSIDEKRRSWIPVVYGAEEHLSKRFRCGERTYAVDLYRFVNQTLEREAVRRSNSIVQLDSRYRRGATTRTTAFGSLIEEVYDETSDGREVLAWSMYLVEGQPVSTKLMVKVLEGLHLLALQRAETAMLVVSSVVQDPNHSRRGDIGLLLDGVAQWYGIEIHDL